MIRDSKNKNNIYQLLPGWGKTMVLTPYLILDILIKPKLIRKQLIIGFIVKD